MSGKKRKQIDYQAVVTDEFGDSVVYHNDRELTDFLIEESDKAWRSGFCWGALAASVGGALVFGIVKLADIVKKVNCL